MSKYDNYINEKYIEYFGKLRPFNIKWITEIVNYFEGKVNEDLLYEFVVKLIDTNSLEYMRRNFLDYFGHTKKDINQIIKFAEENSLSRDDLENGLLFALDDNNKNVIDGFVKYLVITHFDKINIVGTSDKLSNDDEHILECRLGDYPLAHITLCFSEDYGINNMIIFDDLLTSEGLRGTKIGEVLFRSVFKYVRENYPDRDLIAYRLMQSNAGGQKFYDRMGGEFYIDSERVPIEAIDTSIKEDMVVFFNKDSMDKKLSEELVPPTLVVNKQKI